MSRKRVPMRLPLIASLVFSLSALAITVPAAHAAPGEAAAVISSCGQPDSDMYSTSEVSGLPLRTLVYGKLRLNFEPVNATSQGTWQFTTGWRGHLPETANEVAKQMACFGQGLSAAQNAASGQTLAADPSIAFREQAAAPTARVPFGIANLWIILFLAGVIAIFAVAIPRNKTVLNGPELNRRPFRRPKLNAVRFRRRPRVVSSTRV